MRPLAIVTRAQYRAMQILRISTIADRQWKTENSFRVNEVTNVVLESLYPLSYEDFYNFEELRNNFYMRFQADSTNSLVSITWKPRSDHILKFQSEQPELYKQLAYIFDVKIGAGDEKLWTDNTRKLLYKAYTIMFSYPGVTSNRMLFE